jgi:ABC-type polar amino acid transport system ATPase subunit
VSAENIDAIIARQASAKAITAALAPVGADTSFRNTADAAARGVALVAQELSLFPHLDILDSLFTMREPRRGPIIDRKAMRERAIPVLERLGVAGRFTRPSPISLSPSGSSSRSRRRSSPTPRSYTWTSRPRRWKLEPAIGC